MDEITDAGTDATLAAATWTKGQDATGAGTAGHAAVPVQVQPTFTKAAS